jgi:hypothetical protein
MVMSEFFRPFFVLLHFFSTPDQGVNVLLKRMKIFGNKQKFMSRYGITQEG